MPAGNPMGYAEGDPRREAEMQKMQQGPKGPGAEGPKAQGPDDPNLGPQAMLDTAKSLNALKDMMSDPSLPPQVGQKMSEAADAFMEVLKMLGVEGLPDGGDQKAPPKGGRAPMQAPVPADAASGGKVMAADNMAAGRKGARPMMG